MLDWAEDGQDEGEADDVVDGVGEGGEEEGLGEWEIYQGLALIGREPSRLCSDWSVLGDELRAGRPDQCPRGRQDSGLPGGGL